MLILFTTIFIIYFQSLFTILKPNFDSPRSSNYKQKHPGTKTYHFIHSEQNICSDLAKKSKHSHYQHKNEMARKVDCSR